MSDLEEYYSQIRTLPTGEVAGLVRQIFTTGLCVGLGEFSHRTRYCYESYMDAKVALSSWDGLGDPPGPWIKQKPEDRLNPKL